MELGGDALHAVYLQQVGMVLSCACMCATVRVCACVRTQPKHVDVWRRLWESGNLTYVSRWMGEFGRVAAHTGA